MRFEFDENKSNTNKAKHGIDFLEAQLLWYDDNRIIIPARTIDKKRFLIIGKINDNLWTGIYTIRKEIIRIISVRRARNDEKEIYKSRRT